MSSSVKQKDLGNPPQSASENMVTNSKLEAEEKKLSMTNEPPPYAPNASEKYPDEKRAAQSPSNPKEVSPSRARNKRLLWVLMACMVGCIFVVFTCSSLNFKINPKETVESYASTCSGHGIELRDLSCVCDLGYTGTHCQENYPIEPAHRKGSTSGSKPSVLLVTDTIGPLNPYNELASAYENIALHLGSNSFQVTVLYVGEENGRFSKISGDYAAKSIKLVQLPSSGLNYGPSPSTAISVDVFRWMLAQHKYDVVHFQANSGAGYYTLLAQKQGLTSWSSKFVVGLDSTSIHSLMQINSGDDKFLSTDLENLKLEYMQEKSIEYADTILVPSRTILDDIRALEWSFKESSAVVLPHIPSKSPKRSSDAEKVVAKELVFVGSLNILNGLPVFCDAIDRLVENDAVPKDRPLRVTYLGTPGYIRELTSTEYLEARSTNWQNIEWDIISEPHTVQEVVTYMTRQGSGSIAVLPRIYEGSAFLFQELVGNNVPIIASRLAAMEEFVEASSSINSMFDVNDFNGLVDRLSNAISDGLMPLEPASQKQKSWSSVFQEIANAEIIQVKPSDESNPLVSVVVVHRNRPKFLKQAIESLYGQTYKNFEVIIIDDGSDDPDAIKFLQDLAWEWWENRGWKVIREPHRYLGAARNTGIKHAGGSYILFMDDDDYAKPHQIETLVRVAKRTNADVVTAGHDLFDGENRPPGQRGLIERRVPLGAAKYVGMLENCFGDSNMMVLRSFFVDFGGFSEDFGVGFEDYEFLAKVVLQGHHLEVIPESLHWYRRHRDAMSFNTDRKANQIRFLRAYMEEHESAPHRQQDLLEYTKKKFFARDTSSLDPYENEPSNTTMTDIGPKPTGHPCGPSLIIDDFAAKDLNGKKINRLGLETNWVSMKDGAVHDGKLMLAPSSFDESYYYSVLSDGCFDATMFNTLEIVVGAQTPVNSSFAVVLRSPKDCRNNTDVNLRSLRTTQYATFNGTRQVLRIQLSDFDLDICRLHGVVFEDFSPSDGNATYVIDSIRLYTECMPYPTEVYQIPPTATGSVPTETSAFNGVAITSMTPPAANISSDLTFTFDGQGFQNYGVNLYCVVDGQKTYQAAVILSEKAASCKVKDLDVLGGHSLTLNVNGTTLPYSKNFFLYPDDAHVTTCQAKGYVNETVYVRADGHNLINTGFVVFVVEGPDFPQPKIIRAVPAWSPFDPYGPPPESNGKPGSHDNFPYDSDDGSQFFDKYFPKDGDFPKDLFPHGFNPGYLPPGADVSAFIDSKIRPTLPAVKSYLSHLAEQTGADYLSMIAEKTGKIVLPTNTDGLPIPTDLVQSLSSLLQTKINTADLPKITEPPKIDLGGIQTEPPKIDLSGIQIPKGYAKRGLDDPKTEILKAHSWTCPMNITTGGLYTVRLSLDGGITTVPGRVNTWIYDSAPIIVKAGFDGSGATVIVSFDKQIRILGKDIYDYTGTVDCSTIFDPYNEGVMKLGSLNDTTCRINEDMLQIALSPESTLRPGDRLQFTERTIFSKFNPFVSEGWLVNGTFAVTKPLFVPTPFVVAVAPKIVGSCDVASISVEQSYNDGGRPLTFYWSTNSSSVNVTNAVKLVNNSTKTVLQLDKGLEGNITYSFTITAENYLGGKSEATTISLFKSENPVPQIQILGSAVQTILMTQDYFLNTETTRSICSYEDDTKFIYKWSFEPGSPNFTIPNAKLNSSSLFIKAGSLTNKVYKLRVEVSTASAPNYKGYDTIEIHGQAPPPSFAIGNGDVTVGVASELLIYAYWYDPLNNGTAPSVAWTCNVMNGLTETPCTVAGNAVLNPTTLLNPKNLQFTIPANTLLPNKQYKFTAVLTPTFDRLAITDDILVTTVSAVVPVVAATIILPSYKARRMLTGDVLNVFADVQAGTYSSYKKLSFAWNSVSGTTQVAGSPVTLSTIDMNTIHVTKNREQLIIREKTLLPGNTYRFQVVVTDTTSGASGNAIVDVSVAKAPTIGSVIPNMSVGSALSDIFEITASQWTVDPSSDMPLSYQFDVFTSPETNGLPAFTFPYQISPKISTFLPTPTTGDKIWIVVTAKSMAGATSKKAISIQVNKVVRNPAQMKTVFADTAKVALASGDTGTYLRIASGVVDDLLAVLASLSSKKFRARDDTSDSADTLNEILDSVVTDVITPSPVTASTLELHACTLQKLVSMPSVVNSANAAAVLAVVHERVETLQAAQDASPDFRLTGRTKECLANTIGSLSTIYAQSFPSSEETRQTLLEASMLTNALYMRDMACGAPAQTFTSASTTEYLAKADLSSFSLSAEDNSTLVTFPDSISATNAGSDVNCFCMQETIQDAGLYSFVSKDVTGLGTVQIASTASNLRLRDCSSVPRDVPKNDAAVLHIEDLTDSVQLNLKLTPTSQTLFDAGKHDVQCVFYDTSNSTPILSTDGITTTAAGGGEYTCGTSHLSTFMLVLSPKVVNVETSPTTSVTSSATSTSTSTSTETDTSDSESSSGIGSGAIAGIVIGVCGGAALAGGAAYFIMKKN